MFSFKKFSASISLLLLIVFLLGSAAAAQSSVSGKWTAEAADSGDKLQLTFEVKSDRGKNVNSHSFAYSDLNGLSFANTRSGNTSFSIVRDAGTVQCTGSFKDGRGTGTFVFTPDQGYISAMSSRGFDFLKNDDKGGRDRSGERLFMAAMFDIKVALADDLSSAHFEKPDVDQLFKAAIFKIDGAYINSIKASGFPNLSMDDVVKAKIFKIDADFVRGMNSTGVPIRKFEDLVKYAIFKVTPEYLGDLRNAGLVDLTPAEIVKLRIFHIDADYVREARAGDPSITVKEIVKKKIKVPEMPEMPDIDLDDLDID